MCFMQLDMVATDPLQFFMIITMGLKVQEFTCKKVEQEGGGYVNSQMAAWGKLHYKEVMSFYCGLCDAKIGD